MKTRSCQSCGATVQLPPEALSATCAFCDSPLVDAEAGAEPVDRVVRFELDRDRAAAVLGKHLSRQFLAPESLRRASRPEELQPVLVPFYAYDATTRTRYQAGIGIHWQRTETYTEVEDGKTVTKTRTVTETEWHDLAGSHVGQWFDHLVSASRGLPEAEANELEPFDLGRSLPWSPALAAGVGAELPTIDHDAAQATARVELRERAEAAIREAHLPGDRQRGVQCSSEVELEAVKLVLLPVWIAVFPGPSGPVRLLVNGQTAEVVGTVPNDTKKLVALVAGLVLFVIGGITLVAVLGGVL